MSSRCALVSNSSSNRFDCRANGNRILAPKSSSTESLWWKPNTHTRRKGTVTRTCHRRQLKIQTHTLACPFSVITLGHISREKRKKNKKKGKIAPTKECTAAAATAPETPVPRQSESSKLISLRAKIHSLSFFSLSSFFSVLAAVIIDWL